MYQALWLFQRDNKEAVRVISELRSVIAVRAKDTEERERCALLRQNHDYRSEETGTAASVSSRTDSSLTSDESHVADCNTNTSGFDSLANSRLASEFETVLQDADHEGEGTLPNHDDSDIDVNNASCPYAKHIALLAVAKSQQMVTLSEDTFSDDDCSADSDG